MDYSEEKNYSSKIICNKGNMILTEFIVDSSNSKNEKTYNITFDFKKLDPKKINIKTMLTPNIYQIIQEVSPDLIEKIFILNELN